MRRALSVALLVAVVGGCAGDPEDGVGTTGGEPSMVTTAIPETTGPVLVTDPPVSTPDTSVAPGTEPPTTGTAIGDLELALEPFSEGFTQPVLLVQPTGDGRRFVVDQDGVVWAVDGEEPTIFLDIRDRVLFQGEQGLLGLAFPPDHAATGRFYVNYTGRSGQTLVSEFSAAGGVPADPSGERIVLEIFQPAANHNGGMIDFGPDGYLWIGMGDGGAGDDRFGHGQNESTLLGTMLRIDPAADGDAAYTVPDDNPGFAAPEVWAIGLRNPWRWSFDGDDLWIADVGQGAWEEINQVSATGGGGANFGWPLFEGDECYLSDCDDAGLTFPVHVYSHGDGCSITGGYVYRGDTIPALGGHYFFGDYCGGWVRSIAPGGAVTEWLPPGSVSGLSGFGVDAAGDLYVTSTDGPVYRLVESG